jgi:hypothetical protein
MMRMDWDDNNYVREIILAWFDRSQRLPVKMTLFDHFISLWISFNAWGRFASNKEKAS